MVRVRNMRPETYQIPIGGKWTLEDLYVFPRAYEQCYFLYLSLHQPNRDLEHSGNYAYEVFPWQGGYSAVDFYNRLKWAVSKRRRPRITRIEYASPGVIELGGLVVAVAVLIEKVVHSICRVPHFSRLSREVGPSRKTPPERRPVENSCQAPFSPQFPLSLSLQPKYKGNNILD